MPVESAPEVVDCTMEAETPADPFRLPLLKAVMGVKRKTRGRYASFEIEVSANELATFTRTQKPFVTMSHLYKRELRRGGGGGVGLRGVCARPPGHWVSDH
jgi:hypothetical protein